MRIIDAMVRGLASAGIAPNILTATGVTINVGCALLFGFGYGGHDKKIKIFVAALVLSHQIDEVLDIGGADVNHRILHEGHGLLQLAELLAAYGFILGTIRVDALDGN